MVRDNQITSGEMSGIQRMLGEIHSDDTSMNLQFGGDGIARSGDVSKGDEAANAKEIEAVRRRFEDMTKDLESQDKLGNFEIQDLMSRYNQNETLASSVAKKESDTESSVIGKV